MHSLAALIFQGKGIVDRFTGFVTSHHKPIVWLSFFIAIVGGLLALFVTVNYDLTEYLPESAESTRATKLMAEEFDEDIANASVMVHDVSITEAIEYKQAISEIPGVEGVRWLDDILDLEIPLESQNQDVVKQYYKDDKALIDVTVSAGEENPVLEEIYELIGETGNASGQAVTSAEAKSMTGDEVMNAMFILVPIIILILIFSTTSWAEPLFFLLAIGVSVLINMGSNLVLGDISYIAFSIAPILQLAVSLDYAIFLLHSFRDYRETESDVVTAMRKAMKRSFPTIAASAATTFFGFMALGFMDFQIGTDLGVALVKGIVFSFLSVMIFLPAFTLLAYKWIDKSQHRPLMPRFRGIGKYLVKVRIPVFIVIIVLMVPCFLAQSHSDFTYGMGSNEESMTRTTLDERAINEVFGQNTPTVVLVPKGDIGREDLLAQELERQSLVTSVVSFTNSVGTQVPVEFLDDSITNQFYSENYARIVVYADIESEGEEAFNTIETIRSVVSEFYPEGGLTAGAAASLYDMKAVVTIDNVRTNLIAISAIALVLILTFRSASFPVILLATIESAIFINLAVPYFTGDPINYIGYLVINTVQLGATVDYAILFSTTYRRNREVLLVKDALIKTINETFFSILVSASILASAGCVLWLTSSNNIVSFMGLLLFRGTLLSALSVVTFLPGALGIFDRIIQKTTWHANFLPKHKGVLPHES